MNSIEVGRNARTIILMLSVAAMLAILGGCSDRDLDDLEPATAPANPVVFADAFEGGLDFAAFEFSYLQAFSIDELNAYEGSASLRVDIPDGQEWAAGAFYTHGPRDLSGYNALTMYARASRNYSMTALGFGIGINYPSDYQAEVQGVSLTTEWSRIVIPIPSSARMTEEHGMLWFSALSGGEPVTIWMDEVEYANVATIGDARPTMPTRAVQALVGETFVIPGTRTTFSVSGEDMVVNHTMNHFDYSSDTPEVVTADGNVITAVALGEATVTATLDGVEVAGEITAQVVTEITQPYVFLDALDTGLDYGSFGDGQYLDALSVDATGGVGGSAALQITVPAGQFAGGAIFSAAGGRDLTGFNALVFDARSDQASYTVANVGFGIGMSAGGTDYQTEITDVVLGTDWQQVVVPIPDAARLVSEAGMFWYSTGQTGNIWFDNIQFTILDETQLGNVRPVMDNASVTVEIDDTVDITGTSTTYDVGGTDVTAIHGPRYYTYQSSNPDVAVASAGVVTAVGGGQATITATLGTTPVAGQVTVTVTAPPEPPTEPAPTPTQAAANVISIFSDEYDDITVDTWFASWSSGVDSVVDEDIAGDNVKHYVGFRNPASYCGIEFTSTLIDVAGQGMTHFHMDVYLPAGDMFGFKLVDFGDDGVYGGDDTEFQLEFDDESTPPMVAGQWVSLDIPLTDFGSMNFGHVAQLVLTRINSGDVWLDNIYFYAE